MKKYCLLGEKLGHSHSPLIHSLIFEEMNIKDASYSKLECTKDELEGIINDLRKGIYSGFNVTIPYKIEIMKYLDEIDPKAKEIGSVNTVAYIDGKVIGYNTDYFGFLNELLYFNVECKNKDSYILGTGGASLAVYKALKDLGSNPVYVSRNPKNNQTISYEELKNKNIDVLVNTTPVGMYPNVDASPLDEEIVKKAKYTLDIIFNPKQTKLLQYANSNMNGLYMLVGQAIKAEEIWQNKKYDGDILNILKKLEVLI